VKGNGDHTSEICHFSGGDGGKEGGFFLLCDNNWCAGWRRRGNNLLRGFAVNEGQVLLPGELWRGGHREIYHSKRREEKEKERK